LLHADSSVILAHIAYRCDIGPANKYESMSSEVENPRQILIAVSNVPFKLLWLAQIPQVKFSYLFSRDHHSVSNDKVPRRIAVSAVGNRLSVDSFNAEGVVPVNGGPYNVLVVFWFDCGIWKA
jgi:hypothetical protein